MPDRLDPAVVAGLPTGPDRIHCAAPGCPSVASPPAVRLQAGAPLPPDGWGAAEVYLDDGNAFVIFLCSRACERAVARRPPELRSIDQPKTPKIWRP